MYVYVCVNAKLKTKIKWACMYFVCWPKNKPQAIMEFQFFRLVFGKCQKIFLADVLVVVMVIIVENQTVKNKVNYF